MKLALQILESTEHNIIQKLTANPHEEIVVNAGKHYIYMCIPAISYQIAITPNPIGEVIGMYDIKAYKVIIEKNEILFTLQKKGGLE